MIYNGRFTPVNNNWPPLVRYPSHYPDRRLSILWFFAIAILALVLSLIALIIVFSVEHSWFHDNYNGTLTRYGLWRLCFYGNNSCDSWFTTNGPLSTIVVGRLEQSRTGINAWQALEIIFLFLTTATLIIAVASIICYRIRHSLHYYLAILTVFCVWPAASIGVAGLFVFGFAVFNVATQPRELDWCFYVNLVAVILSVIAAILLSVYDSLLKRPTKNIEDDTVIESFADINGYPSALSPSTFVIIRKNKKTRNKPYDYPQILHPNQYFSTTLHNEQIGNGGTNSNFTMSTNPQLLTPYTSTVTTTKETNTIVQPPPPPLPSQKTQTHTQVHERIQHIGQQPSPPPPPPPQPIVRRRSIDYHASNFTRSPSTTSFTLQPSIPFQTQTYRPPISTYQYQVRSSPSNWHRTGTNTMNRSIGYASEPSHDYLQRDAYFHPNRSYMTEQTFERKPEPRLLHYYTGYDYFATVDPSDPILTRHHSPIVGPGTAIRYNTNIPYHHQGDFIKSTM